MKRLIAILLVFSMSISMTGCNVSKEDLEDAAKDVAKEVVGDAVDDAISSVEDGLNQKKEEISESLNQNLVEIPKESTENKGSGLSAQYCNHDEPYSYQKDENSVTCKCGSQTFEEIDYETFKSIIPPYSLFNIGIGITKKEYYADKYSTYRDMCVCELDLGEDSYDTYIFNDSTEDYSIYCSECYVSYPVKDLKFSIFLDYYYPNKKLNGLERAEKLSKLDEKQKTEALTAYIRTKTTMAGYEMSGYDGLNIDPYAGNLINTSELTFFHFLGSIANKTENFWKFITFRNSKSFYLIYDLTKTHLGDAKFFQLAGKIDASFSIINLFESVSKANEWEEIYRKEAEKEEEYQNVYNRHQAYLEFAVASADIVVKLANFIGNLSNVSGVFPDISTITFMPDTDDILEDVKQLGQTSTLREIYNILSLPVSDDKTISDMLTVNGYFDPTNSNTKEAIEEKMKAGPSAMDIATEIPNIISQIKGNKEWKTTVETALWYYYGWRLEYEYPFFLNRIYNDEL